jgi:hypothetical protein
MDINNNIFPEKIIRTTGSDGSNFTSRIYSFENWGNLSLIGLGYFFAVLAVIAPFASLVLLLFYTLSIDRIPSYCSHNFFGGIFSLYLLFDIHKGWLLSVLIDIFTEPEEFKQVIYLQIGLLILHTLLFFFGNLVYTLCLRSKFISFLAISFMVYISYNLGMFLITNNIIKI